MVHALRSRRVITPDGELDATVVIDDGIITAVVPTLHLEPGTLNLPVEDLGNLALLPGLIDAHTHINEPGRTEWEGFVTATRAAAAGGFTTLVDMPLNSLPETTNVAALEAKRSAAQGKTLVDYALWGGCVDGNQADIEPLARAGVPGYKSFLIYPGCDGFTAIDRDNLERALPHIAKTGLPLLVHAELAAPIDAAISHLNATSADWRSYTTYLASRPDEAELQAIALLIDLCRKYRFRLHIVHLSTAKALPMLDAAIWEEGLPITVETCPHYLHFAAEDIPDGSTLHKCAPPIRSAANREALWEGLRKMTIRFIATDHSPCPTEMKQLDPLIVGDSLGRFDRAWGGIASLSTALPVMWTECAKRGFPLVQLVYWMAFQPSLAVGLGNLVGSIEPGKHANLVAFDPDATFTVTPEVLHYRHKISPYMGETLRGVVRSTWLRGERIFNRSEASDGSADVFADTPRGREYTLSCSFSKNG